MDTRLIQIRSRLHENERRIEQGTANNALIEELKADLAYANKLYSMFEQREMQLKQTAKVATLIMNIFRSNAVRILQDEIKSLLDMLFPDEDFIPLIQYDSRGDQSRAELLLGKYNPGLGKVEYGHPANMNGGMVKQLITASAIAAINVLTGSPIMMLDEAFCSGDRKSLAELQPFINNLVSRGMQIILVEHSQEFCDGLPRWEINLQKTRSTGEVHVIDSSLKDMPADFAGMLKKLNAVDNLRNNPFANLAAAHSDRSRRLKEQEVSDERVSQSIESLEMDLNSEGMSGLLDLMSASEEHQDALKSGLVSSVQELGNSLIESVDKAEPEGQAVGAEVAEINAVETKAAEITAVDATSAVGEVNRADTVLSTQEDEVSQTVPSTSDKSATSSEEPVDDLLEDLMSLDDLDELLP